MHWRSTRVWNARWNISMYTSSGLVQISSIIISQCENWIFFSGCVTDMRTARMEVTREDARRNHLVNVFLIISFIFAATQHVHFFIRYDFFNNLIFICYSFQTSLPLAISSNPSSLPSVPHRNFDALVVLVSHAISSVTMCLTVLTRTFIWNI